jgi:hypothetical protein
MDEGMQLLNLSALNFHVDVVPIVQKPSVKIVRAQDTKGTYEQLCMTKGFHLCGRKEVLFPCILMEAVEFSLGNGWFTKCNRVRLMNFSRMLSVMYYILSQRFGKVAPDLAKEVAARLLRQGFRGDDIAIWLG